jgi:hypothetical protein
MCGRARLSSDVSEMKLVFGIPPERPAPNFAPSWNAAPTDQLPVVHYDAKDHQRSLDVMRWGLIPYWAKDIKIGFTTFNARADEIEVKPAFREAFQRRHVDQRPAGRYLVIPTRVVRGQPARGGVVTVICSCKARISASIGLADQRDHGGDERGGRGGFAWRAFGLSRQAGLSGHAIDRTHVSSASWSQRECIPAKRSKQRRSRPPKLLDVSDEVGTIASGKSADVIAVDSSPLDDVSVLQRMAFVMARGDVYLGVT